jgi:hypothetical protein
VAWALFTSIFLYDRRPKQALAFSVKPGKRNMPRDVVDAAVAAGKAEPVKAPGKTIKQTPAA